MKHIFLSNIVNPAKDKYGPQLSFTEIDSYGHAEAASRAKEHQRQWLEDKKRAAPKGTSTHTVEQLEAEDMIGVYMPIDKWALDRAKATALRISRMDVGPREGIDENEKSIIFDVDKLDRGLVAAGKRTNPEVVNILTQVAARLWIEEYASYYLTWAIHRGTLMSRDCGDPFYFRTEAEGREKFRQIKRSMNDGGCQIWFAYLNFPDGTKELLEQNSYV